MTKTLPNGLKCGALPTSQLRLSRLPWMSHYLRKVPKGPKECRRTVGFNDWGMLGNNRYGNCVVAGWAHMKQAMSFVDDEKLNSIPESEVNRIYFQLSPGDNGLVIDRFLQWTRSQPHPWTGGPSGVVDPADRDTLKKCVWWLGGAVLGIGVPNEWGGNVQNGFVWDRVGHFEGVVHDVQAVDYNERGLEIITWGARGTITWEGMREQCGEVHAVLAPDWYGQDSKARAVGLDVEALQAYLTEITGGPEAPDDIGPPIDPDPDNPPDPAPGPGPSPTPPPTPNPPPYPGPGPKPECCPELMRGLSMLNRGAEILKKNPTDPRIKTALDWLEGWLRD